MGKKYQLALLQEETQPALSMKNTFKTGMQEPCASNVHGSWESNRNMLVPFCFLPHTGKVYLREFSLGSVSTSRLHHLTPLGSFWEARFCPALRHTFEGRCSLRSQRLLAMASSGGTVHEPSQSWSIWTCGRESSEALETTMGKITCGGTQGMTNALKIHSVCGMFCSG